MVVCSPFMEVIGDIIPSCVGGGILKVNDNVAVVWGTVAWRMIQFQQVSVLCIVIYRLSVDLAA
jgi:hypothetical protein